VTGVSDDVVADVVDVVDVVEVAVPAGGRVLVVSHLRLSPDLTPASDIALTELARVVEAIDGPGALVLAGDALDLLTSGRPAEQALAAHPRLVSAIRDFGTGPCRRVVYLPGHLDGRVVWDRRARADVAAATGAELALAADLVIDTGGGERRVRVEPGRQLDPATAVTDPHNPLDRPLGSQIAAEVLPRVAAEEQDWLGDVSRIAMPGAFSSFLASRLAYRRLGRHLGWLLLPFLAALLLKLPLTVALIERTGRAAGLTPWARRLVLAGSAALVDLAVVGAIVVLASRRAWVALSAVAPGLHGHTANDAARSRGRQLVGEGYAGLVSGHTSRPELTLLGGGFYANAGCCTEVVDEAPAHLGLPPVYLASRRLSWVELEAGADLHVRLLHSRMLTGSGTRLERLAAKPEWLTGPQPELVGAYPQGPAWPPLVDPAPRLRRTRRTAAAAIALAGVLDLVSALTPPLRGRLDALLRLVPLAVPQAADALVALAGLGLLLVSRGVRRGQRHAWTIAMGLLAGSVILHVVKGFDLEESAAALAVAGYLLVNRSAFRVAVDRPSVRRGLVTLALGGALGLVVGTVAVEAFPGGRHRLPLARAVAGVAERLVGVTSVNLPDRVDDFVTPALVALGIGLVIFTGWLLFRPVVTRRHVDADAMRRGRDIVRRHGRGTLSYFALRSDKELFFSGDSLVAYAVVGGVCLVSPDPVGPRAEQAEVWADFHRFADEHGWVVAVMGASEEWLPVYRSTGMHDLYVGDEAVVDVERFNLEGGRNKGLRQAVNRVANKGYRVELFDPARLAPQLQAELREVMTRSRRGDVERGFSMTLGRVFDPDDRDLLLAVCFGPGDRPVAFCQYVPAPGIQGYSLDLMRRDEGDHPNGILDFVVVETIEELRRRGMKGLSLNFATMRAVLSGEAGEGLTQRVERWLLRRMSDSMQIESLWKFNAKYNPDWRPAYAVYDAREHVLPAALAVARAESFWELPLIGRFLTPAADEPASGSAVR
jgi:lysylphosphatidylglycerol synthetase-like protein (DUF2156 family)